MNLKKLVLGITTFNRCDYLQRLIVSWNKTRDRNHLWTLVVADDGSSEGTLEYLEELKINGVRIHVIKNKRRGVHHQTNQIIRFLQGEDFDCCFKVDDDLVFKNPGWDNEYLNAIEKTGYEHLVFYDLVWGKKQRGLNYETKIHETGLLESNTISIEVQGAFFTITPNIIEKVGFFDTINFGPRGYGHTDYTLRCCRAGFNEISNPYDLKDSGNYLYLPLEQYRPSVSDRIVNKWNTPEVRKQKKQTLHEERIFIPYNESNLDMSGCAVSKIPLSFVVPLRGREQHISGLLNNLKKYYGSEDYEVIFAYQDDDTLFKRGQLCNLGYKKSVGEIVVFIDVDIRFLSHFNFEAEIAKNPTRPVLAFTHIQQLDEGPDWETTLLECQPRPEGYGGCGGFTREQFEKYNGFSNLVIGWGGEDNLINQRCQFRRVRNTLGHVKHGYDTKEDPRTTEWHKRNVFFWFTDGSRDSSKDSFRETIAKEEFDKEYSSIECGVYMYRFRDITVPDSFVYNYYLNADRELHGLPKVLSEI